MGDRVGDLFGGVFLRSTVLLLVRGKRGLRLDFFCNLIMIILVAERVGRLRSVVIMKRIRLRGFRVIGERVIRILFV